MADVIHPLIRHLIDLVIRFRNGLFDSSNIYICTVCDFQKSVNHVFNFSETHLNLFDVILPGLRFGGEFLEKTRWNEVKKKIQRIFFTSSTLNYVRSTTNSKHNYVRFMLWNTQLGKINAKLNAKFCKINAKLCKIYASFNANLFMIYAKFDAKLCNIGAQASILYDSTHSPPISHNCAFFALSPQTGPNSGDFFPSHSPQSPHFLQKFTAFTAFLTQIHPKTSTRVIWCANIHYRDSLFKVRSMSLKQVNSVVKRIFEKRCFQVASFFLISLIKILQKWYQGWSKNLKFSSSKLWATSLINWQHNASLSLLIKLIEQGGSVICLQSSCSDPARPDFLTYLYFSDSVTGRP